MTIVVSGKRAFEIPIRCDIRSDSATNIADHRNGLDRIAGTQDGDPFDGVEELDGVRMVGLWTLDRLYACAAAHGFLPEPIDFCKPGPEPDDMP